jgi:hypothetical protein
MMVRTVAAATAAFVGLVLGAVPALAASPNPYDAYDQTAFLAYLNAPAAGGDLTRPPRLRISFGGRSYAVVMDTGSTGIVVSADKTRTSIACRRRGRAGSPIPAPAAS